ncbi:MAG: phosphate ABC transporter permease subunit PstC [Armatimonadota bacterium]
MGTESKNIITQGKRKKNLLEKIIEKTIIISGGTTIIIVLLLFVYLMKDAYPAFAKFSISSLVLGKDWYPLDDIFGMLPLILGSLYVTAGAIVIGVPIGVAAAIYIGEIAHPRIREILKPTVETLAAIPSVVIGFLGLVLLAPWIKDIFNLPTGLTALTGSIMLAFMAMPTIISISEDALNAIPNEYRAGSLALGATKWQTISRVVFPAAKSGILAAVMLGIGRAIGETMTVLMVTGNAAVIPHTLLQPVRTMTATIAAEMGETVHYSLHYHSLFAVGAILFMITFVINLIADLALHRKKV